MTEILKDLQDMAKNANQGSMEQNTENAKKMICNMCEILPTDKEKEKCIIDAECE